MFGQIKHDCGCGGGSTGLSAEHAPAATDPFFWTGVPVEAPTSEASKAEKAPAKPKPDAK